MRKYERIKELKARIEEVETERNAYRDALIVLMRRDQAAYNEIERLLKKQISCIGLTG